MNYKKFECVICGHIYDEELGDPDGGIPLLEQSGKISQMIGFVLIVGLVSLTMNQWIILEVIFIT